MYKVFVFWLIHLTFITPDNTHSILDHSMLEFSPKQKIATEQAYVIRPLPSKVLAKYKEVSTGNYVIKSVTYCLNIV